VAPATGEYELTVTGNDGFRLFLDGRPLIEEWTATDRARAKAARVSLESGRAYDLRLEFFEGIRDAEVRLGWQQPGAKPPAEEALAAAQAADVVLFVGGLTGDVEGEEMKVSFPGFAGGDRTDLALPSSQRKLLESLQATGKPIVLVLLTGSALSVRWAKDHLPAILVGWYPGQEGGRAVADALFGDANPAGRLPVTFYESVAQLPPFDDYDMKGRTYRYFAGTPLYPFGHGLSYTTFEYGAVNVDRSHAGAHDPITVTLPVKNTGSRAGDEVVQLYVRAVKPPVPMPIKQLRAFERVTIAPGQSRQLTFRLTPQDAFARYDENSKSFVVDPGEYEIQVGASSADIRGTAGVRVE
jgi:beta-glucosidase